MSLSQIKVNNQIIATVDSSVIENSSDLIMNKGVANYVFEKEIELSRNIPKTNKIISKQIMIDYSNNAIVGGIYNKNAINSIQERNDGQYMSVGYSHTATYIYSGLVRPSNQAGVLVALSDGSCETIIQGTGSPVEYNNYDITNLLPENTIEIYLSSIYDNTHSLGFQVTDYMTTYDNDIEQLQTNESVLENKINDVSNGLSKCTNIADSAYELNAYLPLSGDDISLSFETYPQTYMPKDGKMPHYSSSSLSKCSDPIEINHSYTYMLYTNLSPYDAGVAYYSSSTISSETFISTLIFANDSDIYALLIIPDNATHMIVFTRNIINLKKVNTFEKASPLSDVLILQSHDNDKKTLIEQMGACLQVSGDDIEIDEWRENLYLPKDVFTSYLGSAVVSNMIEIETGAKYMLTTTINNLYDVAAKYYRTDSETKVSYICDAGLPVTTTIYQNLIRFILFPPEEAKYMLIETRDLSSFNLKKITSFEHIDVSSFASQTDVDEIYERIDLMPGTKQNLMTNTNKGHIYMKSSDNGIQLIDTVCSYMIELNVSANDVISAKSYVTSNLASFQIGLTNIEPEEIDLNSIISLKTYSSVAYHINTLTADTDYKYVIVSARNDENAELAQETLDRVVLVVNKELPSSYIDRDYYISESDLTNELQQKINQPQIDIPDWVTPNKPIYTASEVNAVAEDLGSYYAGKPLVVGVDGLVRPGEIELSENPNIAYVRNEKADVRYLAANCIDLSNATIPSNCTLNDGTFTFTNMTSGQQIIIPTSCIYAKKYLVRMYVSDPQEGRTYTKLGNKYAIDMYNGVSECWCGFIADSSNANLTLTFYSNMSSFSVSNIRVLQLVSSEEAVDQWSYQPNNVTSGSFAANDVCSYWNCVPSMLSTFSKAECTTRCVVLGLNALTNMVTGTRTVAIGSFAGSGLEFSDRNIILGSDAFWQTKIAKDNVVIGKAALGRMKYINGVLRMGEANYNVAVGSGAMSASGMTDDESALFTPEYNVAVGYYAGCYSKTSCVCVGHHSGYGRGVNEVAIGSYSGSGAYDLATNCTCVGSNASISIGSSSSDKRTISNSTAIGYNTRITKSNQVVIGNSSVSEFILGNKKIIFNEDGTVTWENIN